MSNGDSRGDDMSTGDVSLSNADNAPEVSAYQHIKPVIEDRGAKVCEQSNDHAKGEVVIHKDAPVEIPCDINEYGKKCNETTLQSELNSQPLHSAGTVTSLIASEEPKDRNMCLRKMSTGNSKIVEPASISETNRLSSCDSRMSQLENSTQALPLTGTTLGSIKSETPILAPSTPSPTLVGRVAAGVVSGVWGMTREAALSGDLTKTSKFEYKYKLGKSDAPDNSLLPRSGGYMGYFCLQVPGKTSPVKVIENSMSLTFVPNTAGELNIRGQGKNRYGPFTIFGTCRNDGSFLELARAYTPKPLPAPKSSNSVPSTQKPSGKDMNRVQAALSKPPGHNAADLFAPVTARSHKRRVIPASPSSFAAAPTSGLSNPPDYPPFGDEGKRPGRTRKAPSHLRDGAASSVYPSSFELASFEMTEALQRCHTIVSSLERLAGADWFSAPVDAVALGVPHYSAIIDAPMDLGTVKRRLDCGLYSGPHAYAADMRLVFRNAMTFNVLPEAPVHEAARNIHAKFEDQLHNLWKHVAGGMICSAKSKPGGPKRDADGDLDVAAFKRAKVANGKSSTKKSGNGKKGPRDDDYGALSTGTGMVPVADLVNMQRQMESMQATIAALQKQASQTEVQVQMNMELGLSAAVPGHVVSKTPRLSKPLTFDEKEALSNDINSLPPEKLAHVVKIVQESMPLTSRHDGDEIEVDIETLDNDTLRHLQKYVKASLGKKRAPPKKKVQQFAPEIPLTSDAMLETVALGDSRLGPSFDSEDDEDELPYDVLGA